MGRKATAWIQLQWQASNHLGHLTASEHALAAAASPNTRSSPCTLLGLALGRGAEISIPAPAHVLVDPHLEVAWKPPRGSTYLFWPVTFFWAEPLVGSVLVFPHLDALCHRDRYLGNPAVQKPLLTEFTGEI